MCVVVAVATRVMRTLVTTRWVFPYWETAQVTGTIPEEKMAKAIPHKSDIRPWIRR